MGVPQQRKTDVARRDRKFVGRMQRAEELQIVRADGSRVVDAQGRTFIDWQMGWCVGNLGWNQPEILARLQAFAGPGYVSPGFTYAPWAELAERLVALAPGKLARAYRGVPGTG